MKKFFARNYKSILVVAIGIPVIAIVGWYRIDPLNKSKQPAAFATAPANTSSTSTTIGLTARSYNVGDCVTWTQDTPQLGSHNTRVVDCNTPHLFEYVSKFDLQWSSKFPTDEEWDKITESNCTEPVNKYLGYVLDPSGKFSAGILHPTSDSWLTLDRTVLCGIQLRTSPDHPNVDDTSLEPFTGKVQGQDQSSLLTVGNCYAIDPTHIYAVACNATHDYQISGNIKLSTKTRPTTDAQWNNAVGNQCETTGLHFAGGTLPAGLQTGWLSIDQSSWDAGERTVQCTLGKYDAGGKPVQTTQSATPH